MLIEFGSLLRKATTIIWLCLLLGVTTAISTGAIQERAVVINEIAWSGTQASSSHEWIELYNNTDEDIDLSDWRLVSDDGSPDVELSGTIPACGFYLLERTDDSTISNIPADQIYIGALTNSGETLRLLDCEGNTVDTANNSGGDWPAGTDKQGEPPCASMERLDPTREDAADNWATNDGITRNGKDADGNPLNGTPKAINFASNSPPIADFTFSPPKPKVNQIVTFDASLSEDPDGRLVAFCWEFGDGDSSTLQTPSHSFAEIGTFTVKLTVTDDDGASDTASKEITVLESNIPPTADFSFSPTDPTTQDVVQFIDESSDSDGRLVAFCWEFGDGSTSNLQTPSHQYSDDGTFTVTLTVTDDDGAADTTSQDITVTNVAPKAEFNFCPEEPKTDEVITFDASSSSDPDGEILTYEWDLDNDGEFEESTDSAKIKHSFSDDGSYLVTLRVTDDDGAVSDALAKTVKVINRSPKASFGYSPKEPTDIEIVQFEDRSEDPDGEIRKWEWDLGDGTTSTEQNPSHKYVDDGTYTVKLTITDDDGDTGTTSQDIKVSNVAPMADFTFSPANPTTQDVIQFTDQSKDLDGYLTYWGWDFGDGTFCPGELSSCGAGDSRSPTHQYLEAGTYIVQLTIIDDNGTLSKAVKEIMVK